MHTIFYDLINCYIYITVYKPRCQLNNLGYLNAELTKYLCKIILSKCLVIMTNKGAIKVVIVLNISRYCLSQENDRILCFFIL